MSSAPAPDRIGRYRIERKIGEGGMGVVYAARDERLDRPVALKTIRGDTDETARRRLWREAQTSTRIARAISAMPVAACSARRVHGNTNQRRIRSSAVAHIA